MKLTAGQEEATSAAMWWVLGAFWRCAIYLYLQLFRRRLLRRLRRRLS